MVGEKNAVRSYKLGVSAITKLSELATRTRLKDFEMKKSLYYAVYKKDISFLKKNLKREISMDLK
jgi:hypothetical protein